MSVDTLLDTLDDILERSDNPSSTQSEIVTDFINGSSIRDHLVRLCTEIVDGFKEGNFRTNPSNNGHFVLLANRTAKNGSRRTLNLQKGFRDTAFYQASPENRVVVPLATLSCERFNITGPGKNEAYTSPNSGLKLSRGPQTVAKRGDIIVTVDPLEVLRLEPSPTFEALVYIDHGTSSTFSLAFDKDDFRFLGTSMTDTGAGKAIAMLEILESIGSESLGDAALKYTTHYSSIVRWRALSSLNKIQHPGTTSVLERFVNDPAPFISTAASRVLGIGKVQ